MLRTTSQRRKLCPKCPVARVADIAGDPCTLLILRDLLIVPRRFNELEDSLGGMSSRTLTKTLRRLQKEGFVSRKRLTRPARAYYHLTKKGLAFNEVISAMRSYGKKYL